METPQKSFMTE